MHLWVFSLLLFSILFEGLSNANYKKNYKLFKETLITYRHIYSNIKLNRTDTE